MKFSLLFEIQHLMNYVRIIIAKLLQFKNQILLKYVPHIVPLNIGL